MAGMKWDSGYFIIVITLLMTANYKIERVDHYWRPLEREVCPSLAL